MTGILTPGPGRALLAWAEAITDLVNTHDADLSGIKVAYKTLDETISNSATLQPDDALFVTLEANRTYTIDMDAPLISPVANDFKMDWTTPVGVSGWWTVTNPTLGSAASAPYLGALPWSNGGTLEGFATDMFPRFRGQITTTAAGTLAFRWAQNTATVANTTVRAGSILIATPRF